jgi:hypothetical protein
VVALKEMATTDAARKTGIANVKRLDITHPFFIPMRFGVAQHQKQKTPYQHL